jgi:hypothetical protein
VRATAFGVSMVSTIAGATPKAGDYSRSDGPALQAQIAPIYGLTVGTIGAVYFSQTENYCVRRVSGPDTSAAAAAQSSRSVSTLIGGADRLDSAVLYAKAAAPRFASR